MSKFCSNCGKEIDEKAVICVKCGVSVNSSNNSDKSANTGFILGLISIIAWILPLAGYPITICGIVFSAKGLKSNTLSSKAKAGLILSIIFLILTLINSIAGVLMYQNYYF